ncbi:MAG: isopentenyl-diphosphate Delta-isomerase [Carbonactinosporaceae bacterium]
MASSRPEGPGEQDVLVELVDEQGTTSGYAPKLAAHQAPGRLHRAFSVFLVDARGRLLLQRRGSGKYHSGGLWSNTCCSHTRPREDPLGAATRRVREELGVEAIGLTEVGTITYQVADPVSGLVEHEWNHLFVGRVADDPSPDPREVDDYAFVALDELGDAGEGRSFTAWFPTVFGAVLPALRGGV